MREIVIGSNRFNITGNPLGLMLYKKEFGTDLLGDLTVLSKGIDSLIILQVTWLLNKLATNEKTFPCFKDWLGQIDNVDFSDTDWITAVIEVATDAYFRRHRANKQKQKQ